MPGVQWDNGATQKAYEALISQPEAIHIPNVPYAGETLGEFADRLCTLVGALIRAVEEFGLEGAICTWLARVDDWRAVNWDQVATQLSCGAADLASYASIHPASLTAVAA